MKKEEIDILLGKYYQGLSTREEEKELRDFFTGKDVPAGYEAEKAIFGFYMAGEEIMEPSSGFEDRIISSLENISAKRQISTRRLLIAVSGVAAGILFLIGSWFFLSNRTPADTYNDPGLAYAETVKILYDVSAKMNKGAASLEPVSKMDISQVKGFRVLSSSRATLGKNLEELDYIQKVIGLTKISEDEKK